MLSWEWEKGRPKLRQITSTDPRISLSQQSKTGNTISGIRSTWTDESTRMLGVYMNPMGDFSNHFNILRKNANSYAARLMSPRLTETDVRIFHRAIYIPAMQYSLPSLAIDGEALSTVQLKVVQTMLQQMHVSSTIPTSICHGPISLGGLEVHNLRTEYGIETLKYIRNAIYSDSEVGNLMHINLQYSQLESGIGEPLLKHLRIHLPYLTPSWILSLVRQYLSNHNMTVTLTDTYHPILRSSSDQYIMQPVHLQQ